MRERDIETAVVSHARANGWSSIKLSGPGDRGKPDRLFLAAGGAVKFVEFKAPGSKPTKLQQRWLNALETLGFDCHVIDNTTHGCRLFD